MRRSCLGWDALGGMAGSSEAERSAYNRLSEGSSPSWPTNVYGRQNYLRTVARWPVIHSVSLLAGSCLLQSADAQALTIALVSLFRRTRMHS